MINVNMTAESGVTLATSGKYCEDNVGVVPTFLDNPKNTLKNWLTANGVSVPSGADLAKLAGLVNGVYVIPNMRKWTISLISDISAGTYSVLFNDPWIGQHYNNAKLYVMVRYLGTTSQREHYLFGISSNALWIRNNQYRSMNIVLDASTATGEANYYAVNVDKKTYGGYHISVYSNGDLVLTTGYSNGAPICSGNYEVLAWIA